MRRGMKLGMGIGLTLRIGLTISIALPLSAAWAVSSSEEKLLAAFIFNITKFTHWSGAGDKDTLRITVVDNEPVAKALRDATDGKSVGTRKLEVSESAADKIGDTRAGAGAGVVVLIPTAADAKALLPKLKGCRCLVISKKVGLASAGAMINFFNKEDRLRFEVNLKAARAENVEFDSQLLRLGELIDQ
jgi:hypothetical protein